jgi:hypothetical protein
MSTTGLCWLSYQEQMQLREVLKAGKGKRYSHVLAKRPAGKAFLEYGSNLDVAKFGDQLGEVDNELERMRARIMELELDNEMLRACAMSP